MSNQGKIDAEKARKREDFAKAKKKHVKKKTSKWGHPLSAHGPGGGRQSHKRAAEYDKTVRELKKRPAHQSEARTIVMDSMLGIKQKKRKHVPKHLGKKYK
jgi:hypothetical protein